MHFRQYVGYSVDSPPVSQWLSQFSPLIAPHLSVFEFQPSLTHTHGFRLTHLSASKTSSLTKSAAANIQLAASQVNIPFIEAEENENPLRTELLKEPIEADAHMNYYVTDKPGLGVELDWDVVEKYAVK